MSRANRLAVLVLVPPIVLLGIVVYVTSAAPETRLATLGVSVLVVVASALAGRSFFVWAQKAMVKKWAAWEAESRQVGNHSGRLALVFAACAFGAVLGPALGRVISDNAALFLGVVAFLAFGGGWALAPDLMVDVRKKYWQGIKGNAPNDPA